MVGRFLWADGVLDILPGFSKTHHRDMLRAMIDDGRLESMPENIVGGDFHTDDFHGPQHDTISVLWDRGVHPDNNEILHMIQEELGRFGREAARRDKLSKLAINTEDTETGGTEGYLKDPHNNLYPYLFPDGGTEMPEKVRHLLKSHVLNQLEEAFEDPDNFTYFTVYGSGVSYNWDEGGDLDVQMWIDIEKFQNLNEDKATWTMDDLLAEVRRNVQMVNFPTVKDIGLQSNDEEANGSMLVQYYPKPGKGTEEENLASKPYACLDLETGEWFVEPKPFDPSFYGLHFLEIMPKASDMAMQAEALLDEYERNVLNWQFWFSLYSRYRNPAYQEQYQEAQRNAIMEKEGIRVMFKGIFGGRADAYSPEGKGIEDERDMLEKVLEMWGIFQRLKHYARAKLPWDEQDLPAPPKEVAEESTKSDTDEEDRESSNDSDPFVISHGWSLAKKIKWVKGGIGDAIKNWQYMRQISPNQIDTKPYTWTPEGFYCQCGQGPYATESLMQQHLQSHGRTAAEGSPEHDDPGGWAGIMEKAQRLRSNGQVQVTNNGAQQITGIVQGDHGTYNTQIWRQDPSRNTISLWDCDCPWNDYSWGRTRQWKKYEGRPCAHTLALYWQALSQPLDDEGNAGDQMQIPGIDPYTQPGQQQPGQVDLNQALQQTVRPAPKPSELTGPPSGGDAMTQEQLTFPGTFSKWRRQSALQNGDYARIKRPLIGYDDRGTQYTVPRNSIVEIIWSDESETIAIYSLGSGPLGPHNARITSETSDFIWVPRTKGTAPRRHR